MLLPCAKVTSSIGVTLKHNPLLCPVFPVSCPVTHHTENAIRAAEPPIFYGKWIP